jgi:hypothetical protein
MFATLLTTAISIGSPADPCPPARYFVIVFGSDSVPYRLRYTHTFVTYVRATPAAAGSVRLDAVTISWLPADLGVNPLVPSRPEPGANLTLGETLAYALARPARVAAWGPFESDAGRFALAVAQASRLESGRVAYTALTPFVRRGYDWSNCVGAVYDADPALAGRRLSPQANRSGARGTREVVERLARAGVFINPGTAHDWVFAALGLDCYPIERRTLGSRR